MRLGLISHGDRLPPEKTTCTAHSIILIELVYKTNKSYYSQVL